MKLNLWNIISNLITLGFLYYIFLNVKTTYDIFNPIDCKSDPDVKDHAECLMPAKNWTERYRVRILID